MWEVAFWFLALFAALDGTANKEDGSYLRDKLEEIFADAAKSQKEFQANFATQQKMMQEVEGFGSAKPEKAATEGRFVQVGAQAQLGGNVDVEHVRNAMYETEPLRSPPQMQLGFLLDEPKGLGTEAEEQALTSKNRSLEEAIEDDLEDMYLGDTVDRLGRSLAGQESSMQKLLFGGQTWQEEAPASEESRRAGEKQVRPHRPSEQQLPPQGAVEVEEYKVLKEGACDD